MEGIHVMIAVPAMAGSNANIPLKRRRSAQGAFFRATVIGSGFVIPVKMLYMKWIFMLTITLAAAISCKKDDNGPLRYFEVGINSNPSDWRDTSFVVATNNKQLLKQVEDELLKPVDERRLVVGKLKEGSRGYNKNAGHVFNWHFDEGDWQLADFTAEVMDGLPYTDVEVNHAYWMDTVKRFGSWGSYVKREIARDSL